MCVCYNRAAPPPHRSLTVKCITHTTACVLIPSLALCDVACALCLCPECSCQSLKIHHLPARQTRTRPGEPDGNTNQPFYEAARGLKSQVVPLPSPPSAVETPPPPTPLHTRIPLQQQESATRKKDEELAAYRRKGRTKYACFICALQFTDVSFCVSAYSALDLRSCLLPVPYFPARPLPHAQLHLMRPPWQPHLPSRVETRRVL